MINFVNSIWEKLWPTDKLSETQITLISLKACIELQKLHEAGYIHRNPSPSQIQMTINPHDALSIDVKLAGLEQVRETPEKGILFDPITIGEAPYLAPEIERKEEPYYVMSPYFLDLARYSTKSDVYAMGMSILHMMTVNFTQEKELEKAMKDDPELYHCLKNMLEKNPKNRAASMNDIIVSLEKRLNSQLQNDPNKKAVLEDIEKAKMRPLSLPEEKSKEAMIASDRSRYGEEASNVNRNRDRDDKTNIVKGKRDLGKGSKRW